MLLLLSLLLLSLSCLSNGWNNLQTLNLTNSELKERLHYGRYGSEFNALRDLHNCEIHFVADLSPRINYPICNGRPAFIAEFPFYVQIENYFNGIFCGGAVIHDRFIVTTARCVASVKKFNLIQVRYNGCDRGHGNFNEVQNIIVDKRFFNSNLTEDEQLKYDIALIMTRSNIYKYNQIKISQKNEKFGKSAIILGFGEVSNHFGNNSSNLHQQPNNISDILFCSKTYIQKEFPEISTTTAFTITGKYGPSDIGAPIIWLENNEYVLGGIYSRPQKNSKNGIVKPIFLRITNFSNWIENQIIKYYSQTKKFELISRRIYFKEFNEVRKRSGIQEENSGRFFSFADLDKYP